MKDVYAIVTLDDDRNKLKQLAWTDDGQLLAIASERGCVYTYLTKLPILGDASGTKLAFLTSLLEVTLANNVEQVTRSPTHLLLVPKIHNISYIHEGVALRSNRQYEGVILLSNRLLESTKR